ncbi:MAG: 2',3'-cyclic-nucleotide 2'-phosphodiesterase/3'-nucleotidase, partial [Moritella dasanensis]
SGKVDVLKSKNGRYSNVAAINVKDFMFASTEKAQLKVTELKQQISAASKQDKVLLQQQVILINALN